MLNNVTQDAKNKHMSTKLLKYDKYKHKNSKCVTFGILKSIQFRDNLYKKIKMTHPTCTSVKFATHINFNTCNKI